MVLYGKWWLKIKVALFWYAMVHQLKDHLLKDKNYYVNAFNKSEYGHDGGPQYNILGEYMNTLPVVVHDYYRV